jgi:hypothetical protein
VTVQVVGVAAAVVGGVLVVLLVVLAVRWLPDLARYRRLRRM